MTTQEEQEEQIAATDRLTPGMRPTVRNTGLYSDYAPLQRLGVYLQNYLAVMANMAYTGEKDEDLDITYGLEKLEDFSPVLLAAMALDTEALQAGYDLYADPDLSERDADAVMRAITALYGEGEYNIPIDPDKTYTEQELENIAAINSLDALFVEFLPQAKPLGLIRIADRCFDDLVVSEDHIAVDLCEVGVRRVFVGDEGREFAAGRAVVEFRGSGLKVLPHIDERIATT